MTLTPAIYLSLSPGHRLTPILPTLIRMYSQSRAKRTEEWYSTMLAAVSSVEKQGFEEQGWLLLCAFPLSSPTFGLLWLGLLCLLSCGGSRWDKYWWPWDTWIFAAEGVLPRASRTGRCLGRQAIVQIPLSLISLGGHKNTVKSSPHSIVHGYPILESETVPYGPCIQHYLLELEHPPKLPNSNYVLSLLWRWGQTKYSFPLQK